MCEESTDNSNDNMVTVFKQQQCPEYTHTHTMNKWHSMCVCVCVHTQAAMPFIRQLLNMPIECNNNNATTSNLF